MRSPFSEEELRKVRETVQAVEAKTSGEIVPVLLPASADHTWVRSSLAGKIALLGLIITELVSFLSHWPLDWSVSLTAAIGGGVLGYVLGCVPVIARWRIGAERLDDAVQTRARAAFVNEGLTETRDRTGVLVFVSQFEREIVILGDRGIHEKVPPDFWNALCREFVDETRSGREIEGLCQVIRQVGDELAKHFPRKSGDTNELSDELRGKK